MQTLQPPQQYYNLPQQQPQLQQSTISMPYGQPYPYQQYPIQYAPHLQYGQPMQYGLPYGNGMPLGGSRPMLNQSYIQQPYPMMGNSFAGYPPPQMMPSHPAFHMQAIPIHRHPQGNVNLNFDYEEANFLVESKIEEPIIHCVLCN